MFQKSIKLSKFQSFWKTNHSLRSRTSFSLFLTLFTIFALLLLCNTAAEAEKMYWTSDGKIQRSDLDGSNSEDLVTSSSNPIGIAVDIDNGKIYWTDQWDKKIQRANLDGSNIEDLVTLVGSSYFLEDIAVDSDGGKIYWTDSGNDKIQRANLDGSNVEDLVTGLDWPLGIAVANGKIYWTDSGTDKIQRANLDGSNVEDLVTSGLSLTAGIAVDPGLGKIYWTDSGTKKIQRSGLDGSNVEDLVVESDGVKESVVRSAGLMMLHSKSSVPTFGISLLGLLIHATSPWMCRLLLHHRSP